MLCHNRLGYDLTYEPAQKPPEEDKKKTLPPPATACKCLNIRANSTEEDIVPGNEVEDLGILLQEDISMDFEGFEAEIRTRGDVGVENGGRGGSGQ